MKIVFTGGGTAGHVMPHLALLPHLRARHWQVHYIGSSGMEKQIVADWEIPYHTIAVGKLRRYFSWSNFTDIFRIIIGCIQAWWILARVRPDVVFSKGGFVSVPVAVGAWLWRIPVVTHESDVSPGLANRLIAPFCKRILYAFAETSQYLPSNKSRWVGLPIRDSLLAGRRARGLELCGFSAQDDRPIILIIGGSQGAKVINQAVVGALDDLLEHYRVIHITGQQGGGSDDRAGYKAFSFVKEDLCHLFSCSDLVISRAGANTIFELIGASLPMLLIPLQRGSRGDQVLNAASFQQRGYAHILSENNLTSTTLSSAVDKLAQERLDILAKMSESKDIDVIDAVIRELEGVTYRRLPEV